MSVSGIEPMPAGLAGIEPLDAGEAVYALSPRQLFWRRFRRDKVAVVCGIIILVEIAVAILAPLIVKILGVPGPNIQNPNLTMPSARPWGPAGRTPSASTSSATTCSRGPSTGPGCR